MRNRDFLFLDQSGRRIDPLRLTGKDRVLVVERKGGERLGSYSKRDFMRKFL